MPQPFPEPLHSHGHRPPQLLHAPVEPPGHQKPLHPPPNGLYRVQMGAVPRRVGPRPAPPLQQGVPQRPAPTGTPLQVRHRVHPPRFPPPRPGVGGRQGKSKPALSSVFASQSSQKEHPQLPFPPPPGRPQTSPSPPPWASPWARTGSVKTYAFA